MKKNMWWAGAVMAAAALAGGKWMLAGDPSSSFPTTSNNEPPVFQLPSEDDDIAPVATDAAPSAPTSGPSFGPSFGGMTPVPNPAPVAPQASAPPAAPVAPVAAAPTQASPIAPVAEPAGQMVQAPTEIIPESAIQQIAHQVQPPSATPVTQAAPPASPVSYSPKVVSQQPSAPVTKTTSRSVENSTAQRTSEQNVMIEWKGPTQIKVGKPFSYQLIVRNTGINTATNVIVRDEVPNGIEIKNITPRAAREADGFVWHIGNLEPQQEKKIEIEMVASKKGELVCNASVTATSPAAAKMRISEPKISVVQSKPEGVLLGDPVAFTISVTNSGDGPADNVVVFTQLSPGLKHDKGSELAYEIGSLGAGETRSLQIICTAADGGDQKVSTKVTAEEGLLSATSVSTVAITQPKLDLVIDGPGRRYLNRQAVYTVNITNKGSAEASNVKVVAQIPGGFSYIAASDGGRHDINTRTVGWFIGAIKAGETRQVSYKCNAAQIGEQLHRAAAVAHRGVKAEAEHETAVEGISALLLEVVDIDDPVEVSAETAYEIRVTNQGSLAASNVVIQALVPKEMAVRGATGPTSYRVEGHEVIFAPLPKLAPRADAIYRVMVTGVGVGDARFQARLTSDSLSDPVVEEESTKVYDD